MKKALIFFCLITFSLISFSQNLEGEWPGTVETYSPAAIPFYPITLHFHLKKNGKYIIRSFTKIRNADGKEITFICNVDYEIIRKDSIILRETATLSPRGQSTCFQEMFLRLFNGDGITELYGDWKSDYGACNFKGRMNLIKQKTKK